MPKERLKASGKYLVFPVVAAFVAACGGGGGGGDSPPPAPQLTTPIGSIAGQWSITETATTANNALCQPPAEPLATYPLWFTQSGNTLTVLDQDANRFSGTISGSAVSFAGSYPDAPGTTTLSSVAVTIAASCNTASGSTVWSYAETGFSCAGTTQFTATRTFGSGCPAAAGATTNTAVTEVEPNDSAGTAQAVTRPVAISGTTATGQNDYYSFSTAGGPVTIMMTGPAGQDIDIELTNSTGTVLDSSTSVTANEAILYTSTAGSYRVRVFPFNVTGTASYTLVIQ